MAEPAKKIDPVSTNTNGDEVTIQTSERTVTEQVIYQAGAPANDNSLTPGASVNDNAKVSSGNEQNNQAGGLNNAVPANDNAQSLGVISNEKPANDNGSAVQQNPPQQEDQSGTTSPANKATETKDEPKKDDQPEVETNKNADTSSPTENNQPVNQEKNTQEASPEQPQPAPPAGIQPGQALEQGQVPEQANPERVPVNSNIAPAGTNIKPTATLPTSQQVPQRIQPLKPGGRRNQLKQSRPNGKASTDRAKNGKDQDIASDSMKIPNSQSKETTEKSSDTKPSIPASTANKGDLAKDLSKGQVTQAVAKKVAGKALDKLGKAVGINAVQKQFILHIIGLVAELITGIGILLFIWHLVYVLIWLMRKERWRDVQALLLPFGAVVVFGGIIIFVTLTAAIPAVSCQVGQNRIPFGISFGTVARIGSTFHADTGNFAQLCSQLNFHGAGAGSNIARSSGNNGGGSSTAQVSTTNSTSSDVTFAQAIQMQGPAIIPGTLLTRPQPLPNELSTQSNQAGYVSPAECRLGDIPYSNESSLQRVRLANGNETIVNLPVHQTIECIQNNPEKVTVRAMQMGKIVRLVYDDPHLGSNITIEYPNNLRVSYYHFSLLPELTLAKTVSAGENIGSLAQTGQNTFRGVTLKFELRSTDGTWQPFNPINQNPELSILTPFPCADDANKRCLLL